MAKKTDTNDLDSIVEQIKNSCPCFCDETEEDNETLEKMIKTLIMLLSLSLCWNDSTCGSFVYGTRVENFDYEPDCLTCKPCPAVIRLPLFYIAEGADVNIKSIVVHTYQGIYEERIVLDEQFYTYRKGEVLIDATWLPDNCCTCNCESYEIEVIYDSGYHLIPECLLPLFCDLLTAMSLSLAGCGSIDECCTLTKPKAYQIIRSKRLGDISYAWDVDKHHTQYIYERMLTENKLHAIAQMSCCNNDANDERLWLVKSC